MGRFSRVSIFVAGLLFIPAVLFAQFNNNTSSPYSRYGLGDLNTYSFGRSVAMGGASLASRYNLQINTSNPASYTAIDSLNFLFEFGIEGQFSQFETEISDATGNNVNFNYFAMSFRINNIAAASLGVQPFSDVGYNIQVADEIDDLVGYSTTYYGTGTISKAFLGIAVEPVKNISLGVNLNYMFGQLDRSSQLLFSSSDYYSVTRQSQLRMRDFAFDFGMQATFPLKDKKEITVAAVFANQPEFTDFASDIIIKDLSYGGVYDSDTLFFQEEEKGKIKFPYTFGGGLSYRKKDVYEINVDYYYQNWSESTFFGQKSEFLTDLNKFAIGAEWVPDKFSIRSFFNRVAYRAGFKYEQSYHAFNGNQVNDFGISFGVGVPVYRSASTINIGAELGRRGTTDDGLVLENYAKVNFSLSLHDLWFIQRKID